MALIDEIARGGGRNPLAAFLVGRENRRQIERQDNIDAQNKDVAQSSIDAQSAVSDLRRAQTEEIRNPTPVPRKFAPKIQAFIDATGIKPVDEFGNTNPEFRQAFVDFEQSLKNQKPLVRVDNNQPPLETAADKEAGKGLGERVNTRIEEANATLQADIALDRLEQGLDAGGQTGFGEETLLQIKGAAATFLGLEFTEEDQQGEVIQKIGTELLLRNRNPESGLGLPGSTSNKDVILLGNSVAGLSKSEGGNRKIINYQRRMNAFKRAIVAEQQRIITMEGGIKFGLDSKLIDFANNYEVFSPQERAELSALAKANPQPLIGRAQSAINGTTTVNVDGRVLEVGSIQTNSRGQSARVLEDGSLEIIE